ncbi:MAG: UDP-N-acetylmuramoyl-L-alanyl-D-glutamate--2,6-diaminopimelate ligase [Candidatus Berkelbacteria bacterium]|nr:UDP-N-acetylmuramoyl-L-alanyl-D-glutamate--2,6-diaminopimelate ligase [Candidatus Berkelbacteria bacterium]
MLDGLKNKIRKKMPGLVVFSHKLRGALAFYLYGMPSRRMRIIGVTGTNGKTTTCHLIAKILEEADQKVGMATTTTFKVDTKEWKNTTNMTSISPFGLQRLLRKMVNTGCNYAVVETTSHAISQYRNWGIKYYVAVLTNITHDHLDYHGSFDGYVETKARIFKTKPRVTVINLDDPSAEKFVHFPCGQILTYSQTKRADVTARKILPSPDGSIFTLVLPTVQNTISLKLPGGFNISNALAAAAACYGLGIGADVIKRGLEKLSQVPGRMEMVKTGQGFTVIVDYAHTPDALEKVYSTLRQATRGRMIAVLGACGDRDKTKRPIMGAIAGHFSDIVVVTDEEPYAENPDEIIEQVAKGVPKGTKKRSMVLGENFFKVSDRRQGIRKALELAQRNDVVVVTGMGAQEFRVVGKSHLLWNDRKVIEEELSKLGYNKK